jgi:bacterioferritin
MKVTEVIELLNTAFADEWLAYYQYWLGAKVVKGPMKDAVIAELTQHAADELRHADMLANRIVQLGGTPVTHPKEWMATGNCEYGAPDDEYVETILRQNIEGEQCAIGVYRSMLEATEGKDPITNDIALQIIQDEVEHEEDLENLKEDIQLLLDHLK